VKNEDSYLSAIEEVKDEEEQLIDLSKPTKDKEQIISS
jgi:hypothetical protein